MSIAGDLIGAAFDVLLGTLGGVAGTYAQGTNTKAIVSTSCVRHRLIRGGDGDMDRDTCTLIILASEFASGFSGSNPVYPSAGDTFTISGEGAWSVGTDNPGDVAISQQGATFVLRCSRERARWTG